MVIIDNVNGALQGSAEISINVAKLSQLNIWIFLHVLLERIPIYSIPDERSYPGVTRGHGLNVQVF